MTSSQMTASDAHSDRDTLLPCPECDLVSRVADASSGQWLRCPRCQHPLARHEHEDQLTPALSLTGLVLLALALLFPYISFQRSGVEHTMTLLDAAAELATQQHPALAALVFVTIVALPAGYLLAVCWIHASLLLQRPLPGSLWLARLLPRLEPWMMADVFAIAALVSLVKIIGMAEVQLHTAFWAYSGFALALLLTVARLHTVNVWALLLGPLRQPATAQPCYTAQEQGLLSCEHCGHLQPPENGHRCQRCSASLHGRDPLSLQRVWALLITAILCCFPAHLYPIMVTTSLGSNDPATIMAGVILFIEHGDWPIALIIFTASVLVPFAKIIALIWLCLAARQHQRLNMSAQMRLYRVTEWIGRWSMIDVFVVAIIVALVQLGNLVSITPGPGGLAFAAVVIFTMLAAHQFDPRLIWDRQQRLANDHT